MANMSYCRFSNTYDDLKDCYNALTKQDDSADGELSSAEAKSRDRLLLLCAEIAEDFESEIEALREASRRSGFLDCYLKGT